MTTQAQYRAVTERRQLDNIGLDPTLVGAVSTSVLLWNQPATVNQGLGGWPAATAVPPLIVWADEENAANPAPGTGTTIKMARRGVWHVGLWIEAQATFAGAFGISLDAPAATLLNTTNPINGTAGILLGQSVVTPAATQTGVSLTVEIPISDGLAGDPLRGIVRFHGNNGAEGALTDAFIETRARYRVTYVGDLQGV